jgi:hypothetical protein
MIKYIINKIKSWFSSKKEEIDPHEELYLKEEVEQKGFPIINEVNRKMEKILRKHKGDSK